MAMFKNAKTIEAPAAPSKAKKLEIHLTGLKQVAEIDALIKALSSVQISFKADVEAQAFTEFMTLAADGTRPESFRGFEDDASASVELRKRSTMSALSEDEVALLAKHGLKAEKMIATPKLFGINPKHAENTELLEKVEAALANIVPEDFIVVQEERSKFVVADSVIEAAFKSKAPREVIKMVTTFAVKPKLEHTDIANIIEHVKDLITVSPATTAAVKVA